MGLNLHGEKVAKAKTPLVKDLMNPKETTPDESHSF
jgi:hypothetical protein